jgi:hypothetical protein
MTSQRARAYKRVMTTLAELGPAKLLKSEQARIRSAADTFVFCADLVDDARARATFQDIYALSDHLVDSGRWTAERARQLTDDLWSCGPGLPMARAAAA